MRISSIHAFLKRVSGHRFGPVAVLVFIILVLSFITRIALLTHSATDVNWSVGNILGIFFIGLFYDLAMSTYFIIPLVLYLWLIPDKLYRKKWQRFLLYGLMTILCFILVFNIAGEWFFWEEFSSRYNFIAVNYLVYTNEVIGNIRESYPLNSIIAGAVIITLTIVFLTRGRLKKSQSHPLRMGKRTLWAVGLLLLPVIAYFTVNSDLRQFSSNRYDNELAGDGIYELFAAFRNNQLDYNTFYKTIPVEQAFKNLRELLHTPDSHFISDNPYNIERQITDSLPEQHWNVVLISVESLSAKFLGIYGNHKGLTPNLDTLAKHSLVFTRLYANGTRTVRGLEALSMSVPPTPGRSIIKRPHNEGLFTLGDVFDSKGYDSKFIYGGYGYFDNMNYFFENNGYTIADRREIPDKDIHFENVWGVADEDLYSLVIKEIESTYQSRKPFFVHVMTTSNHRPYTYPEGRIDIPSHTGRDGAVKYTDYAIGKFLHDAGKMPWFKHTIFAITADHCGNSAGKTDLPVNRYHIPLLIYAPYLIQPRVVNKLMSQIDIPPTILGLLHFSYKSKFYGYDIFKIPKGKERAFIGTYQNLGYIRDSILVILKPKKKVEVFYPNFKTGDNMPAPYNDTLVQQAVSYYQSASDAFDQKLDKNIKRR
jgi:phosphoglycerol transferase MdoB-like AlkP superfamily enzyme